MQTRKRKMDELIRYNKYQKTYNDYHIKDVNLDNQDETYNPEEDISSSNSSTSDSIMSDEDNDLDSKMQEASVQMGIHKSHLSDEYEMEIDSKIAHNNDIVIANYLKNNIIHNNSISKHYENNIKIYLEEYEKEIKIMNKKYNISQNIILKLVEYSKSLGRSQKIQEGAIFEIIKNYINFDNYSSNDIKKMMDSHNNYMNALKRKIQIRHPNKHIITESKNTNIIKVLVKRIKTIDDLKAISRNIILCIRSKKRHDAQNILLHQHNNSSNKEMSVLNELGFIGK